MGKTKVYFDSRKCLGCHSCEFVCAVEHSKTKDPHKAHLEEEMPIPRLNVEFVEGMCLTMACRHCDPAPCVEACIAGAMNKDPDTGQVSCNADKCIGCWMCIMVCPFDAVVPGKTFSIKCDMCHEHGSPVCVEACHTRALFEATPEEYAKIAKEKAQAKKAESLK